MGKLDATSDLSLHILTDAGFTTDQADFVVAALVHGVDLHDPEGDAHGIVIEKLSPSQKEALEKFNMAVAFA